MKAEIITIGSEILFGSIVNTNAKYISEKLMELGVTVKYQTSVSDDEIDLKDSINIAIKRADVIILSGGLGPTEDDITKEVLADIIDRKLITDEEQKNKLLNYFEKRNINMTTNNLKQVLVIEGSTVLNNENGTAPGEFIEWDGKKIFLLPGPPRELEPMVNKYFKIFLSDENNIQIKSFNVIELGESVVEDRIRKLNISAEGLNINTFASFGEVEVKIVSTGSDFELSKNRLKNAEEIILKEFNGNIYSEEYISMSEALIKRFQELNLTIGFAESITGGLISSAITSYPNASKILKSSLITYSNEAKKELLGVSEKTLEIYGAVSQECAYEMAKGLKKIGLCDIAVSVTGEAGPITYEDKPIGLVYVCYYIDENNYEVKKYNFFGKRKDIQERTVKKVLAHLLLNYK